MRSERCLELVLCRNFVTVLDVGTGDGEHAKRFRDAGKQVTCIDLGDSEYFDDRNNSIIADFNTYDWEGEQFDLVWASHVLEHQLEPHTFLKKIRDVCKPNGLIAVTVPPPHTTLLGGHVQIYNMGTLLYQLVMAGIDCSDAVTLWNGWNLSVIVTNTTFEIPDLTYDVGDVKLLEDYFPNNWEEGVDTNNKKLYHP